MGPAAAMKMMAAHGLPLVPAAFALTILVEFGCALLLMVGYKARWAALLMFLSFVPVAAGSTSMEPGGLFDSYCGDQAAGFIAERSGSCVPQGSATTAEIEF
jgi:uncharacterized membrane protein YphA (DoxX/SURF4 family)